MIGRFFNFRVIHFILIINNLSTKEQFLQKEICGMRGLYFRIVFSIKFNNMRKVLIASLTKIKPISRVSCLLIDGNVFLFNTKQNSFFKKKEVVAPEILREEDSKQEAI